MRILVYGDHIGSGGYYSHFKGVFNSDVWGNKKDLDTIITGSKEFLSSLGELDKSLIIVPSNYLASKNIIFRYLWHLLIFPFLVAKVRPDIEFFPSGNLRDFLRRPKSVTMCRNLLPFDYDELEFYNGEPEYNYWKRFAQKQGRIFERSSGVIFLSDYSKNIVTKQFPNIKDSVIIPHGIDDAFRLVYPRCYDFKDRINVLYISPIFNYKHQSEVVLAIDKLRKEYGFPLFLKLVGGHNENKDLKSFKKIYESVNADTFTELLPFISREETLIELRKADIFVFASSCECFPNSLVEAMASRLPIACSNRVGLPNILKDSGVYFDPANSDEIADAVYQLVINKELRSRLGNLAYSYSNYYSWERCTNETINFLKLVASK